MAAITCTNCGAVLKTKDPIPPGKKVKCPKCAEAFVVPEEEEAAGEEEETPKKKPAKASKGDDNDDEETKPKKKPSKAASEDEEDDEDDEKPKKKKGKEKKSKTGLILGIVGGVLLLCCCGCGGASWAFQATLKGLVGLGGDVIVKDLGKDMKAIDKGGIAKNLTPDFKMTAEELSRDFSKNQKAGEAKYKDKVIEVTGEVKTVGPTPDQIMLKGVKKDPKAVIDFGIRLGIPPDQQAMAGGLAPGQKVKAVGRFFSYMDDMYLTLTDCTLTPLEGSQKGKDKKTK